MRSHAGAQHIVGIPNPSRPLSHRLGHCVFERGCSRCHRVDLRSEETHPVDIERLPLRVFFPHEHFTLHTHESRCRSGCDPVLPCSCLCDHSCLPHLLRKEYLSEHIIDLMCTRVVQVFTLQIDFSSAQIFTHPFCIV